MANNDRFPEKNQRDPSAPRRESDFDEDTINKDINREIDKDQQDIGEIEKESEKDLDNENY